MHGFVIAIMVVVFIVIVIVMVVIVVVVLFVVVLIVDISIDVVFSIDDIFLVIMVMIVVIAFLWWQLLPSTLFLSLLRAWKLLLLMLSLLWSYSCHRGPYRGYSRDRRCYRGGCPMVVSILFLLLLSNQIYLHSIKIKICN